LYILYTDSIIFLNTFRKLYNPSPRITAIVMNTCNKMTVSHMPLASPLHHAAKEESDITNNNLYYLISLKPMETTVWK
jgi:hypothetical protein